ncbi:MAG: DUF2855 family protein [Comamonadaceae bacterium]|nr:DUF2855 family protein [Comamonadaceae bacterium]
MTVRPPDRLHARAPALCPHHHEPRRRTTPAHRTAATCTARSIVPDPDSPAAAAAAAGRGAPGASSRFALTSNNITYAAFGEADEVLAVLPGGRCRLGLPAGVGLCDGGRVASRRRRRRSSRLGLLPGGHAPGGAARAGRCHGLRRRRRAPAGTRRRLQPVQLRATPTPPGGPRREGLQARAASRCSPPRS